MILVDAVLHTCHTNEHLKEWNTVIILCFWRQVWVNSVDPDQTAPEGSVYYQSNHGLHCLQFACIFWTYYSMVISHNSNFRMITTGFGCSEFSVTYHQWQCLPHRFLSGHIPGAQDNRNRCSWSAVFSRTVEHRHSTSYAASLPAIAVSCWIIIWNLHSECLRDHSSVV